MNRLAHAPMSLTKEQIAGAVGPVLLIETTNSAGCIELTGGPLWSHHGENAAREALLSEIAKRAENCERIEFRVWPEVALRENGQAAGYARARFVKRSVN